VIDYPNNRNRLNDWQIRFVNTVKSWTAKDFAWGQTDCFQFVGACVEAITGVNHTYAWKGKYRSEAQALKLLASNLGSVSVLSLLEAWRNSCDGTITDHKNLIKGDIVIARKGKIFIHGIALDGERYITRSGKHHAYRLNKFEPDTLGVAI